MALFDNCILASDIDGTLLDNGYISPRNIDAIKSFTDNGGFFVLSTGRGITAIDQVFAFVDKTLVGPCVVLNGGVIYDFKCSKALFSNELTAQSKEFVNAVSEHFPAVGIEIHSDLSVYIIHKTEATEVHDDYESLEREYVTFSDIKDKPWNKVLYTCSDEDERTALIEFLAKKDSGDNAFVKTAAEINKIRYFYLEQLPYGTTKANGLKRLCKILNIKKGGFFAIGDYYNDVEMLSAADISAVPAEAPEDIKKIANFVGGPCRKGAVADFIEYLSKSEVQK